MLPGFLENFLKSKNFSVVLRPRQNHTGYHSALVQLFSRHLSVHSFLEAYQRDAAVVGSFTPVSLLCMGRSICQSFASALFQNAMPFDTHESAKSSNVPSSPNSLSKFLKLALSSDLEAASEG